ncbi:MAG: FAD-dependent oxidoreductase [Caldilineaceae bacterium]
MNQTAEVVICGAGIAGVATAYYLAIEHGVTDILLIDKHPPLSQTTAKSGENYRNWWPNPYMAHFISRSIDLMDELAAATDNLFQMKRRGYLYATANRDATALLNSITARYAHLNVGPMRIHRHMETAYLDSLMSADPAPFNDGADILLHPELMRAAFPHLAPEITMLIHVRRAGDISVQQLGAYLLAQARARGAQVLTGEVTGLRLDAQGVAGVQVQTKEGALHVSTRRFVNAAGPFATHVLKMLGVELPIHTVFQQKIAMQDPLGVAPRTAPFTIFLDEQTLPWRDEERTFWQSDPDYAHLLARFPSGLHVRPEGSGASTWLKLGWALQREPSAPQWEPSVSAEFPEIVVRGATRLVPGLAAYWDKLPTPVVHYGGYYVKTPENLPLIGPLAVPGAFIVGALAGYGTMAGCAAGELCAACVADNARPAYGQALSPVRYADSSYQAQLATLNVEGEL